MSSNPDIGRKVRAVQRGINQLNEFVDELIDEMHRPDDLNAPSGITARGARPGSVFFGAIKPIREIEFTTTAAGKIKVLINGVPVRMSPKCAQVLKEIAADDGGAGDGLVAWKEVETILNRLEKVWGRRPLIHALDGLVHRLRKYLTAAGLDRDLVQVCDGRKRLSVRRPRGLSG